VTTDPLLAVDGLTVQYPGPDGDVTLVDHVTFDLAKGSALGLVGESGSGKTMTLRAILGLLPPRMSVSGSVRLDGYELVGRPERALGRLRGRRIALVPQDPMAALNPIRHIGSQLAEGCRLHLHLSKSDAKARVLEYLHRVGLPEAEQVMHRYPHQLSGGMRQRVMIAMALLAEPDIVLCDEPTTALDVTIQAQILRLLQSVCADVGAALIFVSHDLAVIRQICQDVVVMYAGRIAETGPVSSVFADPRHGYTASLLRSLPDVDVPEAPRAIPGEPPDPRHPPSGCRFHPRCAYRVDACPDLKFELAVIGPGRRSACIHAVTGLPEPDEPTGAEAFAAEEPAGPDLPPDPPDVLGPLAPEAMHR
jgi:oligopeptide/dipeptide ABC transporter ATP-binding protein